MEPASGRDRFALHGHEDAERHEGAELAENLKAMKPDLRIIYTSGYSPDTFSKSLRLSEGLNYLPKPYPPPRLVETIRACLDAAEIPG